MALHVVRHEPLAVFVVIQSPGIRGAVTDNFDCVFRRVIPPHTAVHERAFLFWSSGNAWIGRIHNSVATVEPAVGPPDQTAHKVVSAVFAPTVEHHDWFAVRNIITVLVRNERQSAIVQNP